MATFFTLLATLVCIPLAGSAATNDATISCAAGERRLYMATAGSVSGVQVYCGDRPVPAGVITFDKYRAPLQIGHDRRGDLFVTWENFRDKQSGLSILNPAGALVAEHAEPPGQLFVDENKSVAYLLSSRRGPDATYMMYGHPVYFATYEMLFRSVDVGHSSDAVPVAGVAEPNAWTIDPLGKIFINAYDAGHAGYSAIFDPQAKRIVASVYAPACAMAAGADGLVYALNGFGELRAFDPRNYSLVRDLKLDVRGPYVGDANYQGRIAIGPDGTAFVANGKSGTLLRYERGKARPSAIAEGVPRIIDLELDSSGNIYALKVAPKL